MQGCEDEPGPAGLKAQLDLHGYVGPFPLDQPALAEAVRSNFTGASSYRKNPHVDNPAVRNIFNDRMLRQCIDDLCVGDFFVWRTAFFAKVQGSEEIGWHHDKHFHTADADDIQLDEIGTHYSILFSITEINQHNGQIELLPKTHRSMAGLRRDLRPYHQRPPQAHFLADLPATLLETAVGLQLPASSFLIFHSALLHRSLPHFHGSLRLGLAARIARKGIEVPLQLAKAQDILQLPK